MYCSFFFRYDPKENKWTRVASMSTRRLGVAVAVLGGFLYAVGGSDGTSPLNTGKYMKMYRQNSVILESDQSDQILLCLQLIFDVSSVLLRINAAEEVLTVSCWQYQM